MPLEEEVGAGGGRLREVFAMVNTSKGGVLMVIGLPYYIYLASKMLV